jgi:phosphoribosyl 1,2-cyclic phosphate phosphodiesterase
MTIRLTILGCGSSGGVPRLGPIWGACDPANPKNRRRRCAVLAEKIVANGFTNVLVDTPADLREQLLDARVTHLDGVLYTHDHADHTHGIDDLRMVAYAMKSKVTCHFDAPTRASIVGRFNYCFEQQPGSGYHPILKPAGIPADGKIRIPGVNSAFDIQAVPQIHGDIASLGFRFGSIAYSPDISDLPETSIPLLEGLDVWIVDALRYTRHESHFSVSDALAWIERLKPKRAILTHMTSDLDYAKLAAELPPNVEPAYDGMVIEVKG